MWPYGVMVSMGWTSALTCFLLQISMFFASWSLYYVAETKANPTIRCLGLLIILKDIIRANSSKTARTSLDSSNIMPKAIDWPSITIIEIGQGRCYFVCQRQISIHGARVGTIV